MVSDFARRVCAALLFLLPVWGLSATASGGARSLLLDGVVRTDGAIIAVGERGVILLSTDRGDSWRALPSPAISALTGVSFADAARGWVCGHGGTLLATRDGGRHWDRQLPDESNETVFLDVAAVGAQGVVAVGAFGVIRVTRDGGRLWQEVVSPAGDRHLNRIIADSRGTLWIAGEAGLLLRSHDGGMNWEPVHVRDDAPSLYGLLSLPDGQLLAHGLRGHAWRMTDGREAAEVSVDAPVMLAASCRLEDGSILLAGAARWFFVSRDGGVTFTRLSLPLTTAVAELLPLPEGRVLALGEAGASLLRIPERP